jgi:hypothetical protein
MRRFLGSVGRQGLLAASIGALAACSSVTVEGNLVDGLDGKPVKGPMGITARTTGTDTSLGCQFLSGEVDESGHYEVSGLCAGPYALSLEREDLWLAEGAEIPDGGFGAPRDLQVFTVPKSAGVYLRAADGTLSEVKTAADLASEKLVDRTERVSLPENIVPDHIAVVEPGQHLVMVGKNVLDELAITPVVPSTQRAFGTTAETVRMQPWWYLGTRFVENGTGALVVTEPILVGCEPRAPGSTEVVCEGSAKVPVAVEKVEAKLDPAKVVEKRADPKAVRWLAADALPKGRYALMREGDRRMYLVDFGGKADPLPEAAAPAAPAP